MYRAVTFTGLSRGVAGLSRLGRAWRVQQLGAPICRWQIVAGTLVAAVLLFMGIPCVIRALNTISTDDAYVNGHVTFVAPRVAGQVARVLVDDNNRVHKGDLLVQLDKEPFQVQVNIAQSAVDAAQADVKSAQAQTRSMEGQARSARFALEHAVEDVDNQIALLHSKVATLDSQTAGSLDGVAPRGYEEDRGLDPKVWEYRHLSYAFERADRFDLIHSQCDFPAHAFAPHFRWMVAHSDPATNSASVLVTFDGSSVIGTSSA